MLYAATLSSRNYQEKKNWPIKIQFLAEYMDDGAENMENSYQ